MLVRSSATTSARRAGSSMSATLPTMPRSPTLRGPWGLPDNARPMLTVPRVGLCRGARGLDHGGDAASEGIGDDRVQVAEPSHLVMDTDQCGVQRRAGRAPLEVRFDLARLDVGEVTVEVV